MCVCVCLCVCVCDFCEIKYCQNLSNLSKFQIYVSQNTSTYFQYHYEKKDKQNRQYLDVFSHRDFLLFSKYLSELIFKRHILLFDI